MDPLFATDSDEASCPDASTAPTTPAISPSSSPAMRPQNTEPAECAALQVSPVSVPQVRSVCCVGAGYVGGPTSAVIAFQNPHVRVTVVDADEGRIRRWRSRHLPVYEPGLYDLVRVARDGVRSVRSERDRRLEQLESLPSSSDAARSSQNDSHHADEPPPSISRREPNLFFSTDIAHAIREADVVFIAVNTPTKARGLGAGAATDMTSFEAVATLIAEHARPGALIVEKSTVPCRTAQLVRDMLATHRPGIAFEVLSNPEFLAAGTAVHDLLHPDRVLIGCRPTASGRRAAAALASLYAAWLPASRILTTSVFSSELAKLVANSMLAQRISSINSVAALCEATGADVDEVARAVGADPRIGPHFLRAGIGFGGSCFKKDLLSLVYLAESLGLAPVADYWRGVVSVNELALCRFAARVVQRLHNTLRGKKVTILGYAFKANTNDTRESPAREIVRTLLEEGPAEIAVYDACCHAASIEAEMDRLAVVGRRTGRDPVLRRDGGPVVVYRSLYEACHGSHALLLTTDSDAFRNSTSRSSPKPLWWTQDKNGGLCSTDEERPRSAKQNQGESTARCEEHESLVTEEPCPSSCPECELERATGRTTADSDNGTPPQVDWSKVSYHMRTPKWVFDGRRVLDRAKMEALGFRVETGRPDTDGRV